MEIYKMENNELKNVSIKNSTCCYFDDMIKLEDFGITLKYFDL